MKFTARIPNRARRAAVRWGLILLAAGMAGCAANRPAAEEDLELRIRRSAPYEDAMRAEAPAPARRPDTAEEASVYRLRVNDSIIVTIRTQTAEQIELVVDENGEIRLPLLPPIRAAGMTATELERAVQDGYIQNRIYRFVTVHVYVPVRLYFVRGEVRSPGRYPLTSGGVTLLQAIATAGGYTDFADPRRIQIIRGNETMRVNARDFERNPDRDIPLESGDLITVPRSWF